MHTADATDQQGRLYQRLPTSHNAMNDSPRAEPMSRADIDSYSALGRAAAGAESASKTICASVNWQAVNDSPEGSTGRALLAGWAQSARDPGWRFAIPTTDVVGIGAVGIPRGRNLFLWEPRGGAVCVIL